LPEPFFKPLVNSTIEKMKDLSPDEIKAYKNELKKYNSKII